MYSSNSIFIASFKVKSLIVANTFAEQLVKKGGVLIIFAQVMKNGEFFAKNMIDLFPSFVTKFLYEDEYGINSYFQIEKIREPKSKMKYGKINCRYDWETRELKRVDELDLTSTPPSILETTKDNEETNTTFLSENTGDAI